MLLVAGCVGCVNDALSDAASSCDVSASVTVSELEPVALQVACTSGLALPARSFQLGALPAGASYEIATGLLSWTPELDQAGHYTIDVTVPTLAERGLVRVQVLDRFDDPDNVPIQEPRVYSTELGLPVLHVLPTGVPNDDDYVPARVIAGAREYAGAAVKYRGATSRRYPKRSYTLKFDKRDPFDAQQRGFEAPRRRVVLTSTFDDNSNLRQRLAFSLWNTLDPEHIQVATYNAVVYVAGVYQGVYVVSDHIDEELLEAHGLGSDTNLYKARSHSANFRATDAKGRPKPSLELGYTKEEGEPDVYDDLTSLIAWIADTTPDAFAGELDEHLRRADFEGWFLLVSAIAGTDSADKNSYLAHDPDPDADGRFRVVPWDFNASFGQNYRTERRPADVYEPAHFAEDNRIFELLYGQPTLRAALRARLDAALEGPWQLDTVLAWFDTWAAQIADASARDEQKWGAAYRAFGWGGRTEFTTHDEEVAYVRAWLQARWQTTLTAAW